MNLARESLHAQIKEILRQKIASNEYDEKLPSETTLMEEFSVSRATIREAISGLVQEGLLTKIQGKGTFINDGPVSEWLGYLHGFSETMEREGFHPTAKTLKCLRVQDNEISERLGTKDIYLIERVRFVDDIPMAIETSYLPHEIGRELKNLGDEEAFYPFIEKNLNILLSRAEQSISSVAATLYEAKFLDIEIGHPLLKINRTTYSSEEKPIEVLQTVYRGDYYNFKVDLKRNRSGL